MIVKKFLAQMITKITTKVREFRGSSDCDSATTSSNCSCKDLDQKKMAVIDTMVSFIVKRDLSLVAILFLESIRPLHYLGSQAMIFFEPYLSIFVNAEKVTLFREAMEDRRYFDYLIERIEKNQQA